MVIQALYCGGLKAEVNIKLRSCLTVGKFRMKYLSSLVNKGLRIYHKQVLNLQKFKVLHFFLFLI